MNSSTVLFDQSQPIIYQNAMRSVLALLTFLSFFLVAQSRAQTITQFPYFNGFEGSGSISSWTNNGGFDWQLVGNTSGTFDGQPGQYSMFADGSINHVYDATLATAIWESPIFEFNGQSKNHDLSFQYKLLPQTSSNYDWGTLRAQIKVNQNDWVTILTNGGLTSDWVTVTINLQSYLSVAGSGIAQMQLRFLCAHDGHSYSTINNDMWIDNIYISAEIPTPSPSIWDEEMNLYDEFGGNLSANGYYGSSYTPDKAFDNNTGSRWIYDDNEDAWIQLSLTGCVTSRLTEYTINPHWDDHAPVRFWVYGAESGGSWEQIDYQNDINWTNYSPKTFSVSSENAYSKFKLDITETETHDGPQIREIDFVGVIGYKEPTVIPKYANSGSVEYRSGISEFDIKTSTAWLIKPSDESDVILTFESFDLSCPSDFLRIYDGENRSATLLGEYRTTYLPELTISSNKALYIEFLTSGGNGSDLGQGFSASYVSTDYAQSTYPWTQVNDTSFVLDGRLGINTPFVSDEFDLLVNGGLVADELVIESLTNAPDYVFEVDYDLKSLEEVKNYIDEHGHLPEVPSAKEFEASGMSVSEMNLLLLKKVEELTLHLIDMQRTNDAQQQQIDSIKNVGAYNRK